MFLKINILLIFLFNSLLTAEIGQFTITRINYSGGGDWYADPSSIPNLLKFIKNNTNIDVDLKERRSKIGGDSFNSSSYLYLTGHGNIRLNDNEILELREHLLSGAFLHADDNYGMDKSFRREMGKLFPEKEWVEIPPNHALFNIYYKFPNGLPKIHEHDNKRPQALGLFHDNKLIVLYTYESDLGDGWEDPNVHNTPIEIRNSALKMGVNIILTSILQ